MPSLKCTLTGKVDAGSTSPFFQVMCSDRGTHSAPFDSDTPAYAGDVTKGLYLWRPKVV